VPFTVALIGLFSVPQAIRLIQSDDGLGGLVSKVTDRMLPTWAEFRRLLPNIVRSSGIGIITGLVPGAGGDTACWFAYNEAKRFSKFKEKFGTGITDGIAAPEAANNAVVGAPCTDHRVGFPAVRRPPPWALWSTASCPAPT